jgi:hypothetical protein
VVQAALANLVHDETLSEDLITFGRAQRAKP